VPRVRTRIAVALVSAAAIGLELALMRAFSFRLWHHFAYMVISVALLGFGASGTAISFLRPRIAKAPGAWLSASAALFAASIPLSFTASQAVEVNVRLLAWSPGAFLGVAAVEGLTLVPFFFAGACIGIALSDTPGNVPGHYAANLFGSGAGALGALVLMWRLSTAELFLATAACAFVGALSSLQRRRAWSAATVALAGAALAASAVFMPREIKPSQYKMISYLGNIPGTETLYTGEGPLGRIDVAANPAYHYAPGLSLQYRGPVPPHAILMRDGETAGAIYDVDTLSQWLFLDHTTAALPYHLRERPEVLLIGAGGGADIALALVAGAARVTALEMNGQVIDLMRGPLYERGGRVYEAAGVEILSAEARGYLAASHERFDAIQLHVAGGWASSSAGVQAAQESYLYTVESFEAMLAHLGEDGILCVTAWAETPPRVGLRVLDTLAEALRSRGLDPAERMAMIRSWATVTLIASRTPLSSAESTRLREFCRERAFDICWLGDLQEREVNRRHVLEEPYYWRAACALFGSGRREFLESYPFEIAAVRDDSPYFFHFLTLRSLEFLTEQVGRRSRAFIEVGYLLVLGAFAQTVLLAALLLVAPLLLRVRGLRAARGKAAAALYFLSLGAGFMLLEMVFLQKFILYLAHPVYSGAAVIAGFLVFAGAGSMMSGRWRSRPGRVVAAAGAAILAVGSAYLLGLDRWLALTQGCGLPVRFAVAAATIAPLALAMGHMFPLGLVRVGASGGALVPWAWAINGFASVAATVAAPLLAMKAGFVWTAAAALGFYLLAILTWRILPRNG